MTNIKDDLVVVTGADERYAIGLVVAVKSVLEHLSDDRQLVLYVMDGGILPATRDRILKSWSDSRLRVHWQTVDMDALKHLVTAGHLNHTTYLRLLIPQILPAATSKAIYLDSDLLIRRDLSLFWDTPMDGAAILAGQETGAPYVDAEVVWNQYPLKYSKVGITTPIKNYRDLGLDPNKKVFNAGVLMIDVDWWRTHSVPERAYECLERNREHVLFCDQYALNVVLADCWKEADTRWNQTAHFYQYTGVDDSPFEAAEFEKLRDDPWICHFTWKYKPWLKGSTHPFTQEFLECLYRTEWKGCELPEYLNPEQEIGAAPLFVPPGVDRSWGVWFKNGRRQLKRKIRSLFLSQPDAESSRRRAA